MRFNPPSKVEGKRNRVITKNLRTPKSRPLIGILLGLLNVVGVVIAAVALWIAVDANRLTRLALDAAGKQTELSIVATDLTKQALDETQQQTKLTRDAVEATREQVHLARLGIQQAQIVSSWQILTTKAPGNSGKREAMEALVLAGQNLSGIDVSCLAMGSGWDTSEGVCEKPTFLEALNRIRSGNEAELLGGSNLFAGSRIDLSGSDLSGANLTDANLAYSRLDGATFYRAILFDADLSGVSSWAADFSYSRLGGANFSGAKAGGVDFSRAYLGGAEFSRAELRLANFQSANLQDSNLSGASLFLTDFSNAIMDGANISGTKFCVTDSGDVFVDCAMKLIQEQISSAWAWGDDLPVFFAKTRGGEIKKLDFQPPPKCPPSLRANYERAQKTGKPEGC